MRISLVALTFSTLALSRPLLTTTAEDLVTKASDLESARSTPEKQSESASPPVDEGPSRTLTPDFTGLNLGGPENSVLKPPSQEPPLTGSIPPAWAKGPRQGEPYIPSYQGRNIFSDPKSGRVLPHEYAPPPKKNWISSLQKEEPKQTPGEIPTAQGHIPFPVKTSARGFSKYTHDKPVSFGTRYYHPSDESEAHPR